MVKGSKGVTLIELMIVIAIIGISAVALIPLGASWVAKTQVEKTQKLLVEAYNKAVTEAIKNPNGIRQTDTPPTVAKLTVTNGSGGDDGEITVKTSDGLILWSAKFPAAISVEFLGSTCTDIKLNNNAALIDTTCTGGYTISRSGVSNVTVTAQL